MNPSKASGFITIYQGNPPTAVAEFRPLSVANTALGEAIQFSADALNEVLATLYGGSATEAPAVVEAPVAPVVVEAPKAPEAPASDPIVEDEEIVGEAGEAGTEDESTDSSIA